MKQASMICCTACAVALFGPACGRAAEEADREALTKRLWTKDRIDAALKAVEEQHRQGLLSGPSYEKRKKMLQERAAGAYRSQSLALTDPPLNFIQNGGFEQINRNSAKNRSRWLWWGGWSWGGDYENSWEERPEFVHSGKFSARITCTGQKGRIGISTPSLPAVPGVKQYTLTYWAKGEGDNELFVNFEGGVAGTSRMKIGPQWKQYTLAGIPESGNKPYNVYFYATGGGTIWLDDVALVPVGGNLEE